MNHPILEMEMTPKGTKDPLLQELEEELGIQPHEEDSTDKSFHEIYAELTMKEELILVIDAADEQRVREGISVVKSRHFAKMKESQVKLPNQKLTFIRHERTPDLPEGQIKLQIILGRPKTVKVHKVIVPTE